MTANLRTIADHPANIIRKLHERGVAAGKTPDVLAGIEAAADLLTAYEDTSNITFVALNNDALLRLGQAYKELVGSPALRGEPTLDLYLAVRNLLGLEDA